MGSSLSRVVPEGAAHAVQHDRCPDYSVLKYLPVIGYSTDLKKCSYECCYCLEFFATGDQIMVLPCFHIFHSACVRDWLAENFICPLCRYDITVGISGARKSIVEKLRSCLSKCFGGGDRRTPRLDN